MWGCVFFVMQWFRTARRSNIKVKEALDLADDFAEIGVKGVSLISDGAYQKLMFHLFNMLVL